MRRQKPLKQRLLAVFEPPLKALPDKTLRVLPLFSSPVPLHFIFKGQRYLNLRVLMSFAAIIRRLKLLFFC
jgi:hypothetical protein